MKHSVKSVGNHFDRKTIAIVVSAIGLVAYLAFSLIFSQLRFPNLDEGAYLYKGLQFAQGNYRPFQDYGFWTNKMYLPFYFYGWIQLLFKPGLLAPRLLAVFLGTMSVAGLWIVIRRISNDYFAAIAVWAMALNATMVSIYSIGNSQVVVICELIWIMVLVLGENRKLWQLLLGAFIAGLMVLTRENMIFVLPFLSLYIFWQHGRRNGWFTFAVMGIIIVIGHLLFWPDILYLWGRQIPFIRVLKELGGERSSIEVGQTITLASRFHSLSIANRVFFLPLTVLGLAIINWKKKAAWEKQWQFKAALFLIITLTVLVVTHILASAGQNYCIYCTTNYFAFFAPVCLILFPLIAPVLKSNSSWFSTLSTSLFVILYTTIIGFSSFEQTGYSLMNIQVPRLKEGRILEGSVYLWQTLTNKFHLDYETLRMVIPTMFGILIGLLLILILLGFQTLRYRKIKGKRPVEPRNTVSSYRIHLYPTPFPDYPGSFQQVKRYRSIFSDREPIGFCNRTRR